MSVTVVNYSKGQTQVGCNGLCLIVARSDIQYLRLLLEEAELHSNATIRLESEGKYSSFQSFLSDIVQALTVADGANG